MDRTLVKHRSFTVTSTGTYCNQTMQACKKSWTVECQYSQGKVGVVEERARVGAWTNSGDHCGSARSAAVPPGQSSCTWSVV